ncbi:unnamed protein product [Effrenium voratum]|uniref:Uncharacterized protein n=1 Tax=Effrenium voratum TaxID=2562239 RepID=A0AA36IUK0_9DINO|nr:unnamed protein product [Effrenium voratum]
MPELREAQRCQPQLQRLLSLKGAELSALRGAERRQLAAQVRLQSELRERQLLAMEKLQEKEEEIRALRGSRRA